MRQRRIAIVSIKDDLHALIIQKALARYDDIECHVIESDRISGRAILNWSTSKGNGLDCRTPVKGGDEIDVRSLDVIWWRRVGYPQELPSVITDPAQIDLINNDCRAALLGLLLNEFQGTWIDHPAHIQLAQNKMVQLRVAQRAGFRVPRTLVSQNPIAIRNFCEGLDYKVIVKSISGTQKTPLFTTMLTPEHLTCEDSMALCPAIYQEYIPGELHIRAQCFGDAVYSVLIKSQALDWRANLNIPFEIFHLAEDVKNRLHNVLKLLGLRMGVIDLKLAPDGEPVWFEINPQGQFLFVEGLTGLNLTSAFTGFLSQEARQHI